LLSEHVQKQSKLANKYRYVATISTADGYDENEIRSTAANYPSAVCKQNAGLALDAILTFSTSIWLGIQ
jgi:spermidine/putrescine-binding protein